MTLMTPAIKAPHLGTLTLDRRATSIQLVYGDVFNGITENTAATMLPFAVWYDAELLTVFHSKTEAQAFLAKIER